MLKFKRGTLEKMDINKRMRILDKQSRKMFGKPYFDIDDYKKESVWVALEGKLRKVF